MKNMRHIVALAALLVGMANTALAAPAVQFCKTSIFSNPLPLSGFVNNVPVVTPTTASYVTETVPSGATQATLTVSGSAIYCLNPAICTVPYPGSSTTGTGWGFITGGMIKQLPLLNSVSPTYYQAVVSNSEVFVEYCK